MAERTILVVEDDPAIRRGLVDALAAWEMPEIKFSELNNHLPRALIRAPSSGYYGELTNSTLWPISLRFSR